MSGLLTNNNIGSYGSGGPNVGGGCNYAQLGAYNQGFRGIRPPVPLTAVSGYYVVPAYSAPGYDTLTWILRWILRKFMDPPEVLQETTSVLVARMGKTREIAAQNTWAQSANR